jgi:hypothetical protein
MRRKRGVKRRESVYRNKFLYAWDSERPRDAAELGRDKTQKARASGVKSERGDE